MAVLSAMAVVALAAGYVRAGYVVMEWDYNTSMSPSATTNGLWWLNTGTGPALLNQDVNVELLGGTTESNVALMYAGDIPSILLVSDTSGAGGYGDITWNGPGLLCPGVQYGFLVPGTSASKTDPADWFEVFAWTGNYSTYQAAYAASALGQAVYVDNVMFQNPSGPATQIPTQMMTNSPAIVLAQATPTPEPSTMLLSVAGMLGLLAYAWRKWR
jgi:hypothetical protein